jgi:RNA polymerase sigma-70 factor (ECF subfamily)
VIVAAAPDPRVLAAARRGDEDAFRQLVEPHRGELHVHCYRMLGSLQDAEDALQETLLRAWRGLGGFSDENPFRPCSTRTRLKPRLDAQASRARFFAASSAAIRSMWPCNS